MRQIITTAFACAFALLTGSTWAAAPVVVWDGDFGTAEKIGTDGQTYTLNVNGNTLAESGSSITISAANGVLVNWSGAQVAEATIIVRYSDLANSGKRQMLACTTCDTQADGCGVFVKGNDGNKLSGWGRTGFYTGSTIMTFPEAGVVKSFAVIHDSDSNPGTALYLNNSGSWTSGYSNTALRWSTDNIHGFNIGGMRGTTTECGPATGMKILSVAIFKQILSSDDIAAYKWPSDVDELYRPFLANFASRIMTITSSGNANAAVDLGGAATFALFDPYAGADTATTFQGNQNTTALPGQTQSELAWRGWASNMNKAYFAPGLVMRFPTYVTGRSITVGGMFAPFTVGGLIVEEGASSGATIPSWTQAGNRYTELGDKRTSDGVPTFFVLRDSFKVARGDNDAVKAGVQIYGDITFDITSEKYFDCNTARPNGLIALQPGAIFRMVGEGTFKVSNLKATGAVTLDYSKQGARVNTTPFIEGNLTIDGDTAFVLPAELEAGTSLALCSGTLTGYAAASGTRRIVTIGEEVMFADLTFTENGEVTYANAIPYAYNTWQGENGGKWSEPSNWSYGTVPTAEEVVQIATGDAAEAFFIDFEGATVSLGEVDVTGAATSFEFADGTVTLAALNSEVDIFVDASDTLIFPNRNASLALASGKAIKGSGRVVMVGHGITGASDLLDTAAFPGCKDANNWTGTLEVRSWHGEADANHSKFGDDLGNINSTVCLNGFKGYVYAKDFEQIKAYEIGVNGVEFVGTFSKGNIGFLGDLIGSGNLKLSLTGNTAKNGYLRFVGDSSAYTGSFSFAENNAFPISLVPALDTTMPLAEFSQRMIILAVEAGAWTVNGDVEVIAGASFDTTKVPTINGKIKFDSDIVVKTTEVPSADGVLFINDTQLTPGTISALSVTVKVGDEVQEGSYHPVTTADGVVAKIVDVAEWGDETINVSESKQIGAALVVGDCTLKGAVADLKVTLGSIAVNDGKSLTLDNITVEVDDLNVFPQAIKLVNGAKLIVNDAMTMLQLGADETLEMEAGTQYSIYNVPNFTSGATLKIKNAANLAAGNYLLIDWKNWPNPDLLKYGQLNLQLEGFDGDASHIRLVYEPYKIWLQVMSEEQLARKPITIECIGDSITHGLNTAGGSGKNYRIPLFNKLSLAGYNVKTVGYWSNSGVGDGSIDPSGQNVKDWNPDWLWHSGKGSARAGALNGQAAVKDGWSNMIDIGGAPDIVLLHIGINDMLNNQGGENDSNGVATYEYITNMVTEILRTRPDVKLVMSAPMCNAFGHSEQTATYQDEPGKKDTNHKFCEPCHEMCLNFFNKVKAGEWLAEIPGAADRLFYAKNYENVMPSWYDNSKLYLNDGSDHCHPNWLGHDIMAEDWFEQITNAFPLVDGPFNIGREEKGTYDETNLGAEKNIPEEYLNGFVKARQLNRADFKTLHFTVGEDVNYDYTNENIKADTEIAKVGYYIEYVRATATTNLHRFVWVDMDAFGKQEVKTLAEVGIPTSGNEQAVVSSLHVYGNHPGVYNVDAADDTVTGFVEFSPYSYGANGSGIAGAPANRYSYDWNDTLSQSSVFGTMQVHRKFATPELKREGQVVFAYNGWTRTDATYTTFGIGNFAQSFTSSSLDWTNLETIDTCNTSGYTVMNIEIWVKPAIEPVAKVGDQTFETLDEAMAAVTGGETLTLLKDVAGETALTLPATFLGWLDLNGHSISNVGDRALVIPEGTTLGLKGTGSVGVIYNYGTLQVRSGTIEKIYAMPVEPNAQGDNNSLVVFEDGYTPAAKVPVMHEWNLTGLFPLVMRLAATNPVKSFYIEFQDFGGVLYRTKYISGMMDDTHGLSTLDFVHKMSVVSLEATGATFSNWTGLMQLASGGDIYAEEDVPLSFKVQLEEGYEKPVVTINGATITPDENGVYYFTPTRETEQVAITVTATEKPTGPTVDPAKGKIEPGEKEGEYIVTPAENVTEIDIANLPAGSTVEIPATVNKITGAAGSTVKIVTPYNDGKLDITGAFVVNTETGVIALNETPGATVKVGTEDIPVQPTLTAADDETKPLAVSADETAVGVKAIPGLTYSLVRSETIGGTPTTVASEKATTSRVTLTDTFADGDKPTSAFYVIKLSK